MAVCLNRARRQRASSKQRETMTQRYKSLAIACLAGGKPRCGTDYCTPQNYLDLVLVLAKRYHRDCDARAEVYVASDSKNAIDFAEKWAANKSVRDWVVVRFLRSETQEKVLLNQRMRTRDFARDVLPFHARFTIALGQQEKPARREGKGRGGQVCREGKRICARSRGFHRHIVALFSDCAHRQVWASAHSVLHRPLPCCTAL